MYYITSVLQGPVGLTRNLSLLLGGVIQIMFPIGSVSIIDDLNPLSTNGTLTKIAPTNLLPRPHGSPQPNDDRLLLPRHLHDDDLNSAFIRRQEHICRSSRILLPLHANLRRDRKSIFYRHMKAYTNMKSPGQLHPLGLRPRDPPPTRPRQRRRGRHLSKLAMEFLCGYGTSPAFCTPPRNPDPLRA